MEPLKFKKFVPITKNETWKFRWALVRMYCYESAPHVGSENRNSAVGDDLIIEKYRFPKKRELKSAWYREHDKALIRSLIMSVNRNMRKENHVTPMIYFLSYDRKENRNVAAAEAKAPAKAGENWKERWHRGRIIQKGATIRCTFFAAATQNNQPAWMRAFFRA